MPPAALEDDGADSHAAEDAHGEGDFMSGISLVEMHAALHDGDGDRVGVADHELSGVADGGGARECGDFGVGNAGGVGEGIGERAQAGAEDQADAWAQRGFRLDELRGGFGERELIGHRFGG